MKCLLFAAAFFLLVLSCQGNYFVQTPFQVSIVGSLEQTAGVFGQPACDYCDCTFSGCTWQNGFECSTDPTIAQYGPDDSTEEWGSCTGGCSCGMTTSGVGVAGLKNLTLISNPTNNTPSIIGRMIHYNNPINAPTPTHLRLLLQMSGPKLAQPFVIAFPLDFIETPNQSPGGGDEGCDPALQQSSTPCDDRFSFEDVSATSSFTLNNFVYTLEIVGFKKPGTTEVLKEFATPEAAATVAYVYGRLITICIVQKCQKNSVFLPPPTCACSCPLTDQLCKDALGSNFVLDATTCECVCDKNNTAALNASCLANSNGTSVFDPNICECSCPTKRLTNADCQAINPLYSVSLANPCECACNFEEKLTCAINFGFFYVPVANGTCSCVCGVTDALCAAAFGSGYQADFSTCGCFLPGTDSGGLSSGAIAGIVIGSIAGACLLAACILGLLALLVFLILKGIIPGIYGYKIEAADVSTMQTSPMYKDTWSTSNAMAG